MLTRLLLLLLLGTTALHGQDTTFPEPDGINPGRDLIPLLPYIFFDSGSAVVPARYRLFDSPGPADSFNEKQPSGDVMEQHHQILNIIGRRLRRCPKTTIAIGGYDSNRTTVGETVTIARGRALALYSYLTGTWKIDSSRITMLPPGKLPPRRSNTRDSITNAENWRAEIVTDDWELLRPIVIQRAGTLAELPTIDAYQMILFSWIDKEINRVNARILKQHVYGEIESPVRIEVSAYHLEFDEIFASRSVRPSHHLARLIADSIRRHVPTNRLANLDVYSHLGPYDAHDRLLPEGRFYSRGVTISVKRQKSATRSRPGK